MYLRLLTLLAFALSSQFLHADCSIAEPAPKYRSKGEGKRLIVKDVLLSNDLVSFTLRGEYTELEAEPNRIGLGKWAHSIGYVPIGLASPSMALWYNQGFFQWSFNGESLHLYRPTFRAIRSTDDDAVIEYSWTTPQADIQLRFAVVKGFDKLVMLARWQAKVELKSVKLKFMAYPATFSKPHNRCATTARGIRRAGVFPLDLEKEKWILLEDDTPDRALAGSAGMVLGNSSDFSKVSVHAGGYGEYVDIEMKPGATGFALALHEMPEMPELNETRERFRLGGDHESTELAKLAKADWDKPLRLTPGSPELITEIQRRQKKIEKQKLAREAERWSSAPKPGAGEFPWFARLPGGPLRIALLCPRYSAWESCQLGARLDLDVRHLYFDRNTAISAANAWPYAGNTGVGTLGAGIAGRIARQICADDSREVIVISQLAGKVIPNRTRKEILKAVSTGRALYLSGPATMLQGWPQELTATPDKELAATVLSQFSWEAIPGLEPGDSGRIGDDLPLQTYRYGKGQVFHWRAKLPRYATFSPATTAAEGLEGAFDRCLGITAAALLAAANRPTVPLTLSVESPGSGRASLKASSKAKRIAYRIQNDLDEVVTSGFCQPGELPNINAFCAAGRRHFLDTALLDADNQTLAVASIAFTPSPEAEILDLELSPSHRSHPLAVPLVKLSDGGELTAKLRTRNADAAVAQIQVWDDFNRLLATADATIEGDDTTLKIKLRRPLTIGHRLKLSLRRDKRILADKQQRFTIPIDYPLDDFTYLLWSYTRGSPATRYVQRRCFELGTDMMDLCHIRGYSGDAYVAREYSVAARSGLRLIPYVTRLAGTGKDDRSISPGLHNPAWFERERPSLQVCARQGVPYAPPAYTLGDENYLQRANTVEGGGSPADIAAFQTWLTQKYQTITKLNAAWKTQHADFANIDQPAWLDNLKTSDCFTPWFDFREFMDDSFVGLHERFADIIRKEHPGARVGWDGPLSYHWKAGYDFAKWCRNLELNQVYTSHWLQGELIRSFARPNSLRGEWGNAIADNEAGFRAIAWHNLFRQHNSCWWWTSWGLDYTPFNPDGSLNQYGKWFFDEARELRSGIGKYLLASKRDNSGIAILYSQADFFANTLAKKLAASDKTGISWKKNLTAAAQLIEIAGLQYDFISRSSLTTGKLRNFRALILPIATCLSDQDLSAIQGFAEAGGSVIFDGRTALLDESGKLRQSRPAWLGKTAGLEAFIATPSEKETGHSTFESGPVLSLRTSGNGKLLHTNIPFSTIASTPVLKTEYLARLREAGLRPFAELTPSPEKIEQTIFRKGSTITLCLERDIHDRENKKQTFGVTISTPGYVYDSRNGELLSPNPIASWPATISRQRPQVFTIFPNPIGKLTANVAPKAAPGETVPIEIQLDTAAPLHIVHLSVFAPGADKEHRLLSTNIDCHNGNGSTTLPFALNAKPGTWTLKFRDATSGKTTQTTLQLQP